MLSTYSVWVKNHVKLKWWSKGHRGQYVFIVLNIHWGRMFNWPDGSCGLLCKNPGFLYNMTQTSPGTLWPRKGLWLSGLETAWKRLNWETLCLGTTKLQNVHGHIWPEDVLSQGICLECGNGNGGHQPVMVGPLGNIQSNPSTKPGSPTAGGTGTRMSPERGSPQPPWAAVQCPATLNGKKLGNLVQAYLKISNSSLDLNLQ